MQTLLAAVVLTGIIASVTALNEGCSRVEDCADAGSTCFNGLCRCWTDQGPRLAEIWSCNSDNTCAMSFPGHVCRISRECARSQGRLGYCQPIGAIRAPVAAVPVAVVAAPAPVAVVAAPAPVVVKAEVGSTLAPASLPSTVASSAASSAATTAASGVASSTYRSVGGGYAGRR